MSLRKNFFYTTLLTGSNYIFPLIIYPYISRVLGVTNIGICNFVDSIVNYCILFSMLGISILGVREVATHANNKDRLKETFSSLFLLNAIYTFIILIIYIILILSIPKLYEYQDLLWIGIIKIVANLFLVEWFFKGLENFKYITIRSVIIKSIYVVSVFLFVRESDDYNTYYLLTVGLVGVNAMYNWFYKQKILSFGIEKPKQEHLKTSIYLGVYMILTSMYTSFNVVFLGFVAGDRDVGYYTTSIKIHSILLAFFTAFTSAVLPRMSKLIYENKTEELNKVVLRSLDLLLMFILPIMFFSTIYASDIIYIIAGSGYEGAIRPMQIVMPLLLIIGLEQIIIIQLLIPLKKDKFILIVSFLGAIIGLILNVLLVPRLASIGSAIVWLSAESMILLISVCYLKKKTNIKIPIERLSVVFIKSIPYIFICVCIHMLPITNDLISLAIAAVFCAIYFFILNYLIQQDPFLVQLGNRIGLNKIFNKKNIDNNI